MSVPEIAKTDEFLVNDPLVTYSSLSKSFGVVLDRLEAIYDKDAPFDGVATGFIDFDSLTGGLQPANLYVVGSRPGHGKTSFITGLIANVALDLDCSILVFSPEATTHEIAQRMLCYVSVVDRKAMRDGYLKDSQWKKISEALGRIAKKRVFIEDKRDLTIADVVSVSAKVEEDAGNVDLLVIDNVNLMVGKEETRSEQLGEISRGLRQLAKTHNCPVVVTANVNRQPETRLDRRPVLADLRDSGSLEEDADTVVFLYQEEVYDPETPLRGIAELIIAKQRCGPPAKAFMAYRAQYGRFENMGRTNLPAVNHEEEE